jgi:hypothetical protein
LEEDLMPIRGSVQLLLLFFRAFATRRYLTATGLCTALLVSSLGAGLAIWGKGTVGGIMADGAWKHAIASEPASEGLPWPAESEEGRTVKRLGMSAVALDEFDSTANFTPALASFGREVEPAIITAHGHRQPELGDVAIGDHITIVAPDGQALVYRVIGTRTVDRRQAKQIKPSLGPAISLVTRAPAAGLPEADSRLVIDAIAIELPAPVPNSTEQKL